MNEIGNLEQELNASLAALGDSDSKPCGCHEKNVASAGDDPFADLAGSEDPRAELELALGAFGGEDDVFSEDALDFAVPTEELSVGIEEIVALTQQYPGLKITFSS